MITDPFTTSVPDSGLAQLLAGAVARLTAAGLANPRLDAELLLAGALGVTRPELLARSHSARAPEGAPTDLGPPSAAAGGEQASVAAKFAGFVARRERHEPVQYILGVAAFHLIDLAIGSGALVPRPETEILVELALARLAPIPAATVLDLGTGGGAIALSLAAARPDLQVAAVDASPAALAWAGRNRARLGLADRVELLRGDLYAPVAGRRFHLIAANLPYLRDDERPGLDREVRDWEPADALFAGADGLDAIRRAIAAAPDHLRPGGTLLLEIAPDQGEAVVAFARARGAVAGQLHPDLAGRIRVAELRW